MMKKENWIKKQLYQGHTVRALWAEVGSPALAEAAVHAGWRVVLVDNEHGTASLETMLHMVRAIESAGGHAIVRIPWCDNIYLKRILDLGIQSIMVPMICDKTSAQNAVDACRYPPLGRRGYAAPAVRASQYGANANYLKEAKDELLLIAQIEHVDAITNIADIAGVDGIDMLFVGPNDLAGSVGKLENLDDAEVEKMVSDVENKILDTGKLMGTVPRPLVSIAQLQDRGHRLIAGLGDIVLFMQAARKSARDWDDLLGAGAARENG